MLRTRNFATLIVRSLALLALLWPSGLRLVSAQQPAQPPTRIQQAVPAQTPTPAPTQTPPARTGRSYDAGSPTRRPAAPAPQYPSPMTFTDITAQTGITFKQAASPT